MTVGAEGDVEQVICMSAERQQLLAALHIPNLHGAIDRGAGQTLAVRAERDFDDAGSMTLECKFLGCSFSIPKANRPIERRAGQALAVGTEFHGVGGARPIFERW